MGLLHWEGGRNLFNGEGGGREIEKVKEAVVGVSKKKRWEWAGGRGREGGGKEKAANGGETPRLDRPKKRVN